jgi:hypothetical protein
VATDSLSTMSVTVDQALADVGAHYVLGISGGKDSARAGHLSERPPAGPAVLFHRHWAELPETYEYLPVWKRCSTSASCASTLIAASTIGSMSSGSFRGAPWLTLVPSPDATFAFPAG